MQKSPNGDVAEETFQRKILNPSVGEPVVVA